jgi:hypothetical protein
VKPSDFFDGFCSGGSGSRTGISEDLQSILDLSGDDPFIFHNKNLGLCHSMAPFWVFPEKKIS